MDVSKHLQRNRRLRCGQSYRYSWGSVLHDKLLCIAFTPTFKAYHNDKFSLELATQYAEKRRLSRTDLIIPLDEIGLYDEIRLMQPSDQRNTRMSRVPYGDIVVTVTTNGYTKILTIADKEEVEKKQRERLKANLVSEQNFLLPIDSEIKQRILKLNIEQACLSLIHKKKELLALFFSKIQNVIEESPDF